MLNRFYTKEFFQKAEEKLSENGVFALNLSFSESAAGENLTRLNRSVFKTLNQVFVQVVVLSSQTNLFLASKQNGLTSNPEVLNERFKQRNIQAKLVSPEYIRYQAQNDRVEKTRTLLTEEQGIAVNKNTKPVAYFYHFLFWLDHFYPSLSKLFKTVCLNFWWALGIFLIILCLICYKIGRSSYFVALPIASVLCAGFSLMALEVLIIFSYQVAVGYLYFRLALLISALMTGMALGVRWIDLLLSEDLV